MPFRAVKDPVDELAGVRHLLLDANLVRVQVHQPALETQAARTEEAFVDPRRPQHVGAEVADERHRRQPQRAAGDEHRDPGRVSERGGDEQAVRDDDQLPLRAQLEREVVGRRARVEGDCLPFADQRRCAARDRAFALHLETKPQVEADLGLPVAESAHAAPHTGREPLARQQREIAAHRDLGNRKSFRKFRNRNGIARLEHLQHLPHPLFLGQTREVTVAVDAREHTPRAEMCQ